MYTSLTNRELEIISHIINGDSNKQIADNLLISVHTVKSNLENIYRKIDVHNRVQVAVWACKNNLG